MYAYITKWLSVITLIATIISFYIGALPPYHVFTLHDKMVWVTALALITFIQVVLLLAHVGNCYVCRLWSDFVLQVTGIAFIAAGSAFTATYPPFSWAMAVSPVFGVGFLIAGRIFAKQSREDVRGANAGDAASYR